MIRFHPSTDLLESYVEGSLNSSVSLMVSAHCDMCEQCRSFVERQTEVLAETILDGVDDASFASGEFYDMLSSITQQPSARPLDEAESKLPHLNRASGVKSTIELDGRTFNLPRTLRRYVDKTGNWTGLVGKLWQAPVELGNQGVANFIYMGRGGSVPEHTHRGTEYTLVIDGEFSDGLEKYDTGDFIYMDGDKTHSPKSDASEGCLVFSIVDQPLHFTSGFARLLNPFSHLFFR